MMLKKGILEFSYKLLPQFLSGLLCILGASIVLLIAVQIIARSTFNAPINGVEELVRYIFIWLTFLGAALATAKGAHLTAGVALPNLLPPFAKRLTIILLKICVIATLILFVRHSLVFLAMNNGVYSAALQINMFYVWLSVPTAAILIVYYLIVELVLGTPSSAVRDDGNDSDDESESAAAGARF